MVAERATKGKVVRLVTETGRDPVAEAFAAVCIALTPLSPAERREVLEAVEELQAR